MNRQQYMYMLLIGTLSTLAFIVGASFQQSFFDVMLIAIVPGIVVGTLCTTNKYTSIPLLVGVLLGGLLSEQFLFGGITLSGLYITGLRIVSLSAMMFSGCYIIQRYNIRFDRLHTISQIPYFLLFTAGTVTMYTVVMSLEFVVIDGFSMMRLLQRGVSAGVFAGIFGSIIYNSHYHDEIAIIEYPKYELLKRFAFFVLFSAVAYYVFSENLVSTTYKEMIIVLGLFYFATAFLFAIRMLFVNNVIIILVYLILYYPDPTYQTTTELFVLMLYLIAMTAITSVMNLYYTERVKNVEQLQASRDSIEQLIMSTNNLFNVQDKLPQYKDKFSREYLRDMFRIACDLYPNFDSASCFVRGKNAVEFVDCVGYDLDFVNNLEFIPDTFDWNLVQPKIVYEEKDANSYPMKGDITAFQDKYKTIKESLRFTVYVGEESYGGMSFDIVEGSQKSFSEEDIEHFTTFQNVMNSYYSFGASKDNEDDMKNHIILSILDSFDLFDYYTGSHSQEVASLASELGIALQLKEADVKTLYWAGLVHDIGKTGITNELLNKEGTISESEMAIIKMHPTFAFKILRQYPTMERISTIVLHHHEWWDGTGYPNQLKAMAIPYLSQILHVADAVCAMGRNRRFTTKMTEEEIIEQLEAGYGTQFSPKVAREMIAYIKSGKLDALWKHNQN